jgi:hypothetical protein
MRSKFAQIWGDATQKADIARHHMDQLAQKDKRNVIYTVSAAVHISDSSKAESQRHLPFFSCPRVYSDESQSVGAELQYVQERFEESDLLPIYSVAIGSSSAQEAFDVIIDAHRPRDSSLILSQPTFNKCKEPLCLF